MKHSNLWNLLQTSFTHYSSSMALWACDRQLTYGELAREIASYRQYLISQGVQAEDRIGVLLPRTSHLIVAILAIFSIGAVYVPLYPRNPRIRNQSIIENSQCHYLIAEEAYEQTVLLSPYSQMLVEDQASLPSSPAGVDDLAYIIYTSGSTGAPKGVMISQGNVLSLIEWAISFFDQNTLSYTLASTAVCFDLSIFEMFVPLVAGGCVVLVENALTLIDQCPPLPISLINTVPSAARALLAHTAIPDSVETINLAGEALEQNLVDELYQTTQVSRVYNLYGPSETTTYSTWYLASAQVDRVMVPIGQAISKTTLYLLDKHQLPTPRLARGEIYLAGPGVTQGYCQKPEETRQRYVTLDIDGQLIPAYRTGDLARLNHNNEYEYLGRIDQQMKIHGFRIELDEIINTLQSHSDIQQAYVMAVTVNQQEQALAGYYTLNNPSAPPVDELRKWLAERLPDYMVPKWLTVLDAFPLNANGKIDRAALPEPLLTVRAESPECLSELERELAQIWQTLLPEASLNKETHFFYVGGHSLLAARLLAKIKAQYAIELYLEELFRYPTLAEQARLIAERAKQKPQATGWLPVARPINIPLSYGQERLWYLQHAEKNLPISNIPIVIEIKGELHISALEESVRTIVKRHEILRTTYAMVNHQLTQQIAEDYAVHIPVEQVADPVELKRLLQTEANQSFDLTKDLMIRMKVFVLNPAECILMVTQHHIASDAWSLNILMQELSLLYNAYKNNTPLPSLPTPVQYADFSCWQREQSLQNDLSYWRERLLDAPDTIALPYDRPRGELQTYKGSFYQWELSSAVVDQLKSVANNQGCSLFMVLLAAFDILLYRYGQQEDFCLGILSANRPMDELSNSLGFFVNSLVTRHHVTSTMMVHELLQQVRQTVLESLEHQQVPFDKLVDTLKPQRQLNRHPFFQVLFSLQNALDTNLELNGLSLDVHEFDRNIAKFDLTISLVERADKLVSIVEYNTDLFESRTIEQMIQHYSIILTSFQEHLNHAVGTMPLLSLQERHYYLTELNQTSHALPVPTTLAACFEQMVHRYLDKIALMTPELSLSYKELNERVNQLANLLVSYGVQASTPVGLLLERDVDAIVSMLAIVKSGGYYVPMDPAWPTERLDYVIQDSALNLILTNTRSSDKLPLSPMLFLIQLDEIQESLNSYPMTMDVIETTAEDVCYVVYTSGSTGQPKGVMATQAGVIRLVHEPDYVLLNEEQRLLQVSPLAFDGSTFDIWGSLLNGASLVLMPHGVPELGKMAQYLMDYKITTLFVTTQLFNLLVEHKLEAMASLKQILFGGEVASIDHVQRFKTRFPQCALSNIYGPTECTTYALSYLIPDDFNPASTLPLGRAISNTCAVILNPQLQICPKQVKGELYLGGPGLAKGYLNQAQLTQTQFIDNPFPELATNKLYRTGDVCFYDDEGLIKFVGRVDNQVKLRGHRIELSEIEQALRDLNDILDAVLVLQKPEQMLVAYVLVKPGTICDTASVRRQLAHRLPDYMLPDGIFVLDSYPLNSNGKVDKAELPKWNPATNNATVVQQEPINNEIATQITQIWCDILEHQQVTQDDNFFEVGGNSLKLILVLERLQEAFKGQDDILRQLEIVTLFQYPTIRALVSYLTVDNEVSTATAPQQKRVSLRDKRKMARDLIEVE
ncbi:MAG: hypothetical protein CK426_02500 [Legionella sp.]|nr:MAG: hypothetical protein CK423_03300 [Legionella sp.]PJD99667.1 MAG: hypothetical protein CK426_02500 [Legionella sp.]